MSEEQPAYLTVEQALNALGRRDTITNDPTASYWLKRAITELWERDTVDALNDLDVLRELLEEKHCRFTDAGTLSYLQWQCLA